MKRILVLLGIVTLLIQNLMAQCPMCKQNVQAGIESGSKVGLGLNSGILYLLAVPYLLAAFFAYWYWKNRNKV